MKLIHCSDDPGKYSREDLGGKGYNLMRLYHASRALGTFIVPDFFILPDGQSEGIDSVVAQLKRPIIVRSSSPFEDGERASFAGMFQSVPGLSSLDDVLLAINRVRESAHDPRATAYAKRMQVPYEPRMPIIIQEQVEGEEPGTIQLQGNRVQLAREGRRPIDYSYLLEKAKFWEEYDTHKFLTEGHIQNAVVAAHQARGALNLQGVVQVEYTVRGGELPYLLQIRALPKVPNKNTDSTLDTPEGAVVLRAGVCNDIPGDIVLPAFVTCSSVGLGLLPPAFFQDKHGQVSETMGNLQTSYKLYRMGVMARRDLDKVLRLIWSMGDQLFPEYVLLCDKLDKSLVDMDAVTRNKRAIITCMEEDALSHAMTVARDLEIIGIGAQESHTNPRSFLNVVKTGDLLHVKSDGTNAFAFVEKPTS